MFCNYLADPRYQWTAFCDERFGQTPVEVFHEDNSVRHLDEYEGDPRRRPFTFDEVQALFDAADGRVEEIRARKRKGVVAALRDSALLKFCYAFGMRRAEVSKTDVVDLRRNPKAKRYGRIGSVSVRHGKASRGGAEKRRTVLTVPEMDWIVEVMDHYLSEVRPAFRPDRHPALWLTERTSRLGVRAINDAFATARDDAGLDPALDLHCLRHSYITHLVEFDYPEKFAQEQAGHAFASTTAIYVGVSNAYRNQLLTKSLTALYGDLGES
jgi:site-specific recombinase XerD